MNLIKDYRKWRDYRQTVRQLTDLSDSTLHDIGVVRGCIEECARGASTR